MRRRVVEVPLRLDHPYWVMDPNFDLEFHIRHLSLAPPGRADQLAEQISRIVGRPMDRSRPLWEVYVIEGLESGRWGLLTKYHHATIDGASGVMMLKLMHDTSPDATPPGENRPWEPEALPGQAELLRLTFENFLRNPAKAARTQLRLVREYAEAAGLTSVGAVAGRAGSAIRSMVAPGDGPRVNLPLSAAPPTPWNRSVTAHRRFAMRSASLDNIKRLKDADRRDAQRRRDGHLRRRPARLPHRAQRADRPAAAGDGAGVDPHRRGGGHVDEPGVRSRRRPADPTSPIRWNGWPGAGRRCWRPSSSSSWCRRRR